MTLELTLSMTFNVISRSSSFFKWNPIFLTPENFEIEYRLDQLMHMTLNIPMSNTIVALKLEKYASQRNMAWTKVVGFSPAIPWWPKIWLWPRSSSPLGDQTCHNYMMTSPDSMEGAPLQSRINNRVFYVFAEVVTSVHLWDVNIPILLIFFDDQSHQ